MTAYRFEVKSEFEAPPSLANKEIWARGFETLEAMRQFRCFLLPVARDLSSSFTVDSPNFLDRSVLFSHAG